MKKALSILLTLVMLLNLIPFSVFAENSVTVTIAVASYDKPSGTFSLLGEKVEVTVTDDENVTVIEAMNKAVENHTLTYQSEVGQYGDFVSTINGKTVTSPDGWLFTVNDNMAMVGAEEYILSDSDKLLWYEGTIENNYSGPMWSEIITEPTVEPTPEPTVEPTVEPTAEPTAEPTGEPTAEPTAEPTVEPTTEPTAEPTVEPTTEPTAEPTATPVPTDFEAQAQKIKDVFVVDATTPENSVVSLLKDAEELADGISVSYSVSDEYLSGGESLVFVKHNDTKKTLSVDVTVTLTDAYMQSYQKNVKVILPVTEVKKAELMDAIALSFVDTTDRWAAMDMMLYQSLEGKTVTLSDNAKQSVINELITKAVNADTDVSYRASIEIILRALGIDSTRLYPLNSATYTDNAQILSQQDMTLGGHYAVPWILKAIKQGNFELNETKLQQLITLLKNNMGDGMFGYEWGGVTYPDADTAAIALAALAPYYDLNNDAKTIIDTVLAVLPSYMDANGSFGSANSDAMMIIGLMATGTDPNTFKNAQGLSVVDGMLGYVNCQTNAFMFYGSDNALATEQGLRALIALEKFCGEKVDIYDFSSNEVTSGRVVEVTEPSPTPTPVPEGSGSGSVSNRIRITVTIKTDTSTWVRKTNLSLPEGATVYTALMNIVSTNSITVSGVENGYVKSMTKGSVTLSEFGKGANSGWVYEIDGEQPKVSLKNYVLADGDDLVWLYTTDWETTVGGSWGSSANKTPTPVPTKVPTPDATEKPQQTQPPKKVEYKDISGHWAKETIDKISQLGIMSGVDEGEFAPDIPLTRAMLVTMLFRLEGTPEKDGALPFKDVKKDAWYYDALVWAYQTGVVSGVSSMEFAPDAFVAREDLALILLRYAKYKNYNTDVKGEKPVFSDNDKISDYATDAVCWAYENKIITGRDNNVLDAKGKATRAEIATMVLRFIENVK